MKNKLIKSVLVIVLILAGVGGTLSGCTSSVPKGGKPSTDWSRSIALGDHIVGSTGMALDNSSQSIYLVWPFESGEGVRLRFVHLNARAEFVDENILSLPGQIRAPRLAPGHGDSLHFFWASREAGQPLWSLWHTLLDSKGNMLSDSHRLSGEGEKLGSYRAISDGNGGAIVAWDHGRDAEVNLLHINPSGEISPLPIVLTRNGESPALAYGSDGTTHIVWLEDNRFLYTSLKPATTTFSPPVAIADLKMGTGSSIVGPVIGAADGWIYILWSVLNQSGLEAGTAFTEYVSFPVGEPGKSVPTKIWIPPVEKPSYEAYSGSFHLTEIGKPPTAAWAASTFILHPAAMIGQADDFAAALAVNQQFRLDNFLQIAVAIFSDGEFKGYTFGSRTEKISDSPMLGVDSNGDLHLLWREGWGGRDIYYATTADDAMANLDRLNPGDVFNALMQGGIESFVSIAFMPFVGFGWLLPGFLVLGVWKLIKDQEKVSEPSSWPPLILALLIYNAIKAISLPTLFTYVPFSAWLYISGWLSWPLRIGVPLSILVISLVVANVARKRYSQSTLMFYLSMALTDAILTLAIYGVNFLGEY